MIDPDKQIKQMQDGKVIALNENVMYPMLSKMTSDTISKMIGKYRDGDKDYLADVAYIAAISDIRQRLVRMQTDGNKVFHDINKENQ